jgi:predicted component of type VI protein secretion system
MTMRKLIVDDGRTTRHVLLVGTITVGRDPSCQISDPDPLLSRRHAEFVVEADRVTLRDLGSRNGILVNGAKMPQRVLASGDLVQFGHLQCQYIEQASAPAPEPRLAALADTMNASRLADAPPLAPGQPPLVADAAAAGSPASGPVRRRDLEDTRPSFDLPADIAEAAMPAGNTEVTRLVTAPAAADTLAADATRVSAPPAPPAALGVDDDATRIGAPPRGDWDVTRMVTGASRTAVAAAAALPAEGDPDVTFAPVGTPAAADAGIKCEAGADLKVTRYTAADLEPFGLSAATLMDAPLGDVVTRALARMASGAGAATLTCVFDRSDDGRTIRLRMHTGLNGK